jgi:hypothetical protein
VTTAYEPRVLPDVEAIASTFLLTVAELVDDPPAGLGVGPRIGTRLAPDGQTQLPFLRLRRISSTAPVRRHLRAGNLQLEGWADTELEAQDVCETATAALHLDAFRGVYAGLGVVTGVDDGIGPRPQPDPITDQPRWLASVIVYAHPIPE